MDILINERKLIYCVYGIIVIKCQEMAICFKRKKVTVGVPCLYIPKMDLIGFKF